MISQNRDAVFEIMNVSESYKPDTLFIIDNNHYVDKLIKTSSPNYYLFYT